MRFPITYGKLAWLFRITGMPPSLAYVDVDGDTVTVKMSWGFSATIPRSSIVDVGEVARRPLSIGVHGWWGRWLVNGARHNLVRITIDPPTRAARVMFFPIKLRELTVSVDSHREFIRKLTPS